MPFVVIIVVTVVSIGRVSSFQGMSSTNVDDNERAVAKHVETLYPFVLRRSSCTAAPARY